MITLTSTGLCYDNPSLPQDYVMITQRAGLEPESLTSSNTMLPGSSQLSDRIEALHNQAIEIRNLALAFYESGHPPTKEVNLDLNLEAELYVLNCKN